MVFSEMSSRERTVVVVLGIIIVVALIGIGILGARLVTRGRVSDEAPQITVAATPGEDAAGPVSTITLVPTPALKSAAETTPQPASSKPIVVVREESPAPLLPAALLNHPLHAGRKYRMEITAADGSREKIRGSWSLAAVGTGVEMGVSMPELFEGTTPFAVDLVSPVRNPTSWSVSASAGPEDLLGQPPILVITVFDVTGSQ